MTQNFLRWQKNYLTRRLHILLFLCILALAGPQNISAAVVINAQCISGSVTGEWLGTADGRQTFIPSVTGTLFKVRLHTATYGSGTTITVRIFSGSPGSGSLLTSMSYFKGGSTNSWDDVFLPGPGITLTAASPYYIEIANGSQVDWIRTSVNAYASGNAWRGGTSYPTYDYNFEVHMAVPTCGAVTPGSTQSGVIANTPSAPLGLNGGGDPGFWTTNGTGTFADPRNPGTTYVPGCPEAGSTTTLTWTSSCGLSPTNQTINVAPPGFVVPNAVMCAGGTATLTGTGAGSFSWSTGATTASINISPGTTTVYTVTGNQGNGCSVVRTPTVTVNPLPLVSASNATVCAGTSGTLTANGSGGTPSYTYNWYDAATGGTLLASSPVFSTPVLAPAGTYSFYPQVTDANACVSVRPTVTVTANPLPPVSVSGGPVACFGGTANLTATGAVTYTWSPGGLNGAAQTLAAGSYTITGTSAAGCTNTTMYSLTQPPGPLVAGISGSNVVCSGTPLNLTLNGSGGTAPYTIQWIAADNAATSGESTGSVSTSLINNTILNPTATSQIITYTITVTDNNSCTATQTVNVTVNPIPVMISASSGAVCSGIALNLPLNNTLGGGSYTWNAANNPNTAGESVGMQTTPIINNTINLLSAGPEIVVYTVTPTSAAGCIGSGQTVNITVNPLPAISSANSIGICSGSAVNYTIASIPAGGTYSWIATDNPLTSGESLSAQTNPVITNTLTTVSTSPINVSYTITPTSAAGCVGGPFSFITSVNPMPTMTSANNATICSGAIVNIPLSSDISSNYNWVASDNPNTIGESISAQSSATLNNAITSSVLTPEVVSYTVTPTALAGGCTGPNQVVSVTVNPLPAMTSTNSGVVCSGSNIVIPLTSNITSTYSWIGADNPNTFGESLSTQTLVTLSNMLISVSSVPETVSYTVTPTSGAGCTGVQQFINVTVNPAPTMTSANAATICSGSSVNILLSSNIGATYSWIASDNPNTNGESTSSQSFTTINNTINSFTSTAAETVSYTVTPTSGAGCVGTGQPITVSVNPAPVITSSNAFSECSGVALNIPLNSSVSSTYVWLATDNGNTTGESTSNQSTTAINNTIISSSASAENVSYTVTPTSGLGCPGVPQNLSVIVNPAPVMTSSNFATICSYVNINIPLSSNIGATYSWIATDNINTTGESLGAQSQTTINDNIASSSSVAENILYTVTPTSALGCPGIVQTVTVNVNPAPVMTSTTTDVVCSGVALNIPLTSNIPATYSWIASDNGNTSGESTVAQSFVNLNDNIASVSSVPETVSYTVTPTTGLGCTGAGQTVNITVNPAPLVTSSNAETICSGIGLNIPLTSNVSSNFTWVATDHPNTIGEDILLQGSAVITNTITSSSSVTEIVSYTITPTSLVGCTGISQLLTVTLDPAPVMTSSNVLSICSGTNVSLPLTSDITATYSWIAADNTNTNGESTSNQSGATINDNIISSTSVVEIISYTVTPSSTIGCAGVPQTVSVSVDPEPVMTSATSGVVCSGIALSFPLSSSIPANYTWIAGDNINTTGESLSNQNATSITDNISSSAAVAETVSYTITPTSAGAGCPGPAQTVNISVNPAPVMTSPTTGTICSGTSVNHSLTSNITASYSWIAADNANTNGESTSNQSSSLIGDNVTSTVSSATIVSYTVVPSSVIGCAGAPQIVDITVNAIPALPTAANVNACVGFTATLTATAPGGTYDWYPVSSGGTSLFTGANYVTPVLTAATTYYVESTIAGCTGPRTPVTVTVNANPVAVVSGPSSFCSGANFTLNGTVSSPGSGTFTTFEWVLNGSSVSGAVTINEVFTNAGSYELIVTNSNGCKDTSAAYSVMENFPPTSPAVTFVNTAYCQGDSVLASVQSPVGAHTYAWSVVPASISLSAPSVPSTYVRGELSGNYTVSVTETDLNGCASLPASTNIQVHALPAVGISASTTAVCGSTPVTLSGTGANSYIWSGGITDNTAFVPTATLTYTVTGTDLNNCSNTASQLITVNALPTVTAGASFTSICPGVSTTLNAGGTAVSYVWSSGQTTASASVSPAINTTYTVTGTDANSCSASATVSITLLSQPALPVAGVNTSPVCAGVSVLLSSSSGADNNWFNTASPASIINTSPSFNHTETIAGVYSYGLFLLPAGGCSSDTAYVSVTFNACLTSLVDEIELGPSNGPLSNNIFGNDGNPAGYTVNTTPLLAPSNGSFTISPSGAYTYMPHPGFSGFDIIVVQACDALFNCLNDTIFITIMPFAGNDLGTVSGLIPNSQLTGNVLVNDHGSGIGNVSLVNNVSSGTLTLSANGDFIYKPTTGYCGPDSFSYQVCDANSLCSSAYCIIDVNCEVNLQTYTGFSPNGDGRNDLWIIDNIQFAENKVTMYDRWGNEIWSGINYDNTTVVWDGRNKSGEELQTGTYFYLIEVKDQQALRGWVEITK
ncbi:MAG: conserved repeat domain protein [Bacteroidetes bacterium]|jgi:gliding motility-associated-like protein|nr:conserved repeat domain protein [Bacteroidota bacterium]